MKSRTQPTHYSPNHVPTAVFVGGTSGIGRAMVDALGSYTDGNTNIVIVGRNRAAADEILAQLPKPTNPQVKHEFIQCDVTRMKNVHTTTQAILSRHPKINFLVLTAGIMTTKGRDETEEGLDTKLAAHYYSRWTFINELLPALKKASSDQEDAKVLSVFSAGHGGGEIDMDDLGLKKDFSLSRAASNATTYNDLMIDEFASRNPELTFIHAAPGAVRTNLLASSDSKFLRIAGPVLNTLLYGFLASPQECANNMWAGVFNHTRGAYQLSSSGKDLGIKAFHGTLEKRRLLWEHTVEATAPGDS
ncbi:NAD(P)-binding protein [Macrolepiota fuliginosa MF-IS2]|uniref:NAD(P)-binding protein n=1 Tax=Macrolepiota fuliginosa MF-IS2 TaxID=1400762 RepID=A0A9P6C002_9AGAR|nr:NAD(P)-binding protein [Macrolepiota fuliginosa MF-IS2]